jgi:hypothetical protein
MEAGKSVRGAVEAAIADLSYLHGGRLREVVIHAVDREGTAHVAAINVQEPVFYPYWNEDPDQPEQRPAEAVSLPFARWALYIGVPSPGRAQSAPPKSGSEDWVRSAEMAPPFVPDAPLFCQRI